MTDWNWLFGVIFFALLLHKNPKNRILKKYLKKWWRYYPFTHVYHKWKKNNMMGFWDMDCNRQIFYFWAIFSPFAPPPPPNLTIQKIKILKKWKKCQKILSFYMCAINDNHMMSVSSDMECNRHNFLSFWTIFCPFTPLKN